MARNGKTRRKYTLENHEVLHRVGHGVVVHFLFKTEDRNANMTNRSIFWGGRFTSKLTKNILQRYLTMEGK